jgi:uncharacterized protein (PEP-CTERM system associated)
MEVMANTASSKRTFFLLCLLFPVVAWAGDWKFTSGISLSERYTDNVNLAGSGAEQSEWITEVTPRFSLQRQGARLKVQADYSLQGLIYAEGSNSNKLRHSLNGRANAELLEEWFFIDASARISHELNSLAGGVGLGDPVGIGNTTAVGSYSISPYLKHRFGSVATIEARVAQDGVFIGDSTYTDTNTTRYTLNAVSGNYLYPLTWGANYSKTENNNSAVADTSSERASANARYQLTQKFGLLAQAGMEKNNYPGVTNRVRDYSYYGVGMSYTPSRQLSMDMLYNKSDNGDFLSGNVTAKPTLRTTVTASAGQRAYGRTYSLGLAHRTRHSNWNLRYQDDLTTYQQQFLNYLGSVDEYSCPSGTEFTPHGSPPSDPVNCTLVRTLNAYSQTQSNETYISKNLIGTVSYNLRRNTWSLSLYSNRREFQTSGKNDTTNGVRATWSLTPVANTTLSLTGGLSRVEESGTGRNDDLWNISLVATKRFQPKLTGSLEVRHQERQSNLPTGDYAENSVAARLNMSF